MADWTPERIATLLQQEITDDQLVSIVLQADAQGTNSVRVTVDKSCLHYLCREIQRLRTALAAYDALRASHAECVAALKSATFALGTHGPCRNNSCSECGRCWKQINAALATAAKLQREKLE